MVRRKPGPRPVDIDELRAVIALGIMEASTEGVPYMVPDDPVARRIYDEELEDLRDRGWKVGDR